MSAGDTLACSYCERELRAEELVAVPQRVGKANLACPTCAAKLATAPTEQQFEELKDAAPKPNVDLLA